MIRTFKHKALERYFCSSSTKGLDSRMLPKLTRLLDRLEAATKPDDMDLPGYRFHPLKGNREGYFSVMVTANWRLTFRFEGEDAFDVNLEDYH